jgi:peptidyl-tRNA hydrolase
MLIQYVIVRSDLIKVLKFSLGAVVTQACHAVAAINEITKDDNDTKQYLAPENLDSMHKCVLSVSVINMFYMRYFSFHYLYPLFRYLIRIL